MDWPTRLYLISMCAVLFGFLVILWSVKHVDWMVFFGWLATLLFSLTFWWVLWQWLVF